MAMTEAMRLSILSDFAETMGEEKAAALMESISPIPWHEFATKDDLKSLKEYVDLKFEAQSTVINAQFSEVQAQFSEVQAQFSEVQAQFSEVQAQFSEVNAQFKGIQAQFVEFKAQFVTMEANLSKRMSRQSWALSIVFGGFAASVLTLVAAGAPF